MLKYIYDASGNVAERVVNALITPQITGQPVKQVVAPGDIATFSVVVADTNGVTFQWGFNGVELPGATGDSLLLTNVSAANEGQYSAVATNSAGSVMSAPAALMLDSDGDGMPDSWEIANFGNLTSQRCLDDADGDGISNLDEFLDGTDPNSNTSLRPRLIVYSGAGISVTVAPKKLSYDLGEMVTLTATPVAAGAIVCWMGDANIEGNSATLTMNGNKTVRVKSATVVPIPPGLVASWRGETDTTNMIATDPIGGHDGKFFPWPSPPPILPVAASITAEGKVGHAFKFDGTYIQVPDAVELHPSKMTWEAWVFTTDLSDSHTVIARGAGENIGIGLGLFNGKLQFWLNHFNMGIKLLTAPFAIPQFQWCHLAATFDGGTKRLYLNGAEVASQGGLSAIVYDEAAVQLTIGANWAFGSFTNTFLGRIDEVCLYNRPLMADEILGIYNADFAGKDFEQPYFTSPFKLPDVALGANYTQQLTTVLGTNPISFSLSAGALSPGMTLSSAGTVGGIPGASGTFNFTVRATDGLGSFNEQQCVLQVL